MRLNRPVRSQRRTCLTSNQLSSGEIPKAAQARKGFYLERLLFCQNHGSFPTGHAFGQPRKDEAISPWGISTAGWRLKCAGSCESRCARPDAEIPSLIALATGELSGREQNAPHTSAATNDGCAHFLRPTSEHRQQGFPPRQSGPTVIAGRHCAEIPCCVERPDTSSSFAVHRISSLGCAWPERS